MSDSAQVDNGQNWVRVTSGRLNDDTLRNLLGESGSNILTIRTRFDGIKLKTEGADIYANREDLDTHTGYDGAVFMRLVNVMASLENIAVKGGKVDEETINQSYKMAIGGQQLVLAGVAEFTSAGNQINFVDKEIPALQDNSLFRSSVRFASCPEDASFIPYEVISAPSSSKPVLNLVASDNRMHLKRIMEKVSEKAGDINVSVKDLKVRGCTR